MAAKPTLTTKKKGGGAGFTKKGAEESLIQKKITLSEGQCHPRKRIKLHVSILDKENIRIQQDKYLREFTKVKQQIEGQKTTNR